MPTFTPSAVRNREKEYPGLHGPLFPDAVELWATNQALMGQRHREGATTNSKHKAESPAFLTGLLYCEHCGGKLWHHFGGRGGSIRYLICSGSSRRVCSARQIRADALEAQALNLFGELCFDEALIGRMLREARALIAGQNTPRECRIDPATIQAKLKRLALVYADEAIDEATYRSERDRLRAMLAESQALNAAPVLHLNEGRALAMLRALPALIGHATTAERRQLSAAIVCKLWVQNGAICGLSPRAELYPLLRAWANIETPPALEGDGVSGGVPDGARTHNILSHSQALCH
jgi:site-specific DNA recombinase